MELSFRAWLIANSYDPDRMSVEEKKALFPRYQAAMNVPPDRPAGWIETAADVYGAWFGAAGRTAGKAIDLVKVALVTAALVVAWRYFK